METKNENNRLEQGLSLQTVVGDNQRAYAFFAASKANSSRYYIDLKSENGKALGEMDVLIVNADKDIDTLTHPYRNCKYLYIYNMVNTSGEKHVGNALHEYAFKMSVANGAEGRVRFNSVRDAHIFHYKNGFLMEMDIEIGFLPYYLSMAEEMLKSGRSYRNLGSQGLYLPRKRINENMDKYGLSKDLLTTPAEEIAEEDEADKFNLAEKIYLEVQQKSLAIQLIIGLQKGFTPYPTVKDRRRLFKDYRPDCIKTRHLIGIGLEELIQLLPLATEENKLKFDLTLSGVMLLIMTFQDSTYGKQSIFNNEYLFPQITYKEILDGYSKNMTVPELIVRLGEDALLKKTFEFDWRLKPGVFPGLRLIPEFSSLFDKYDLKKEITPDQTTGCKF